VESTSVSTYVRKIQSGKRKGGSGEGSTRGRGRQRLSAPWLQEPDPEDLFPLNTQRIRLLAWLYVDGGRTRQDYLGAEP
jgi:hypothetical protein